MCPLQDVKQSGFEATLLVDPVNDIAVGGGLTVSHRG